jgi:hypothetical protein
MWWNGENIDDPKLEKAVEKIVELHDLKKCKKL